MIFDKLADAITGHAKIIVAIWAVILIVAAPLALKAGDVMLYDTNEMAGSDSESVKGLEIINENFSSSGVDVSSIPIVVIKFSDSTGRESAKSLIEKLGDSQNAIDSKRWAEIKDEDTGDLLSPISFISMAPQVHDDGTGIYLAGVMYTDGALGTTDVSDDTPNLRGYIKDTTSASEIEGVDVYLTGTPAISYDMATGSSEDISRIDPFTILLILILVGLFFRSFISSATPPMTIGVAFIVVLALIYGIGQILNIFFITEMMLLVSMMGAGCDYCIFIISRYREELRSGLPHKEALHQAVVWAGESIATSGASVIIGFGAMSICSFSLVSTMGICLAVGILVALMAALTLIPAVLALVGDRIFWPTRMNAFEEGGKATRGWYAKCGKIGKRYFEASSRFSIKHAKAIVLAAVLVTVPAAYLMETNETSYDMISSMQSGDSGEGMDLIGEYANQGMLMPNYSVIQYDTNIAEYAPISYIGMTLPGLVWTENGKSVVAGLKPVYEEILKDDNVAEVSGPFVWSNELVEARAALPGASSTELVAYIIKDAPTTIQAVLSEVIQSLDEQGFAADILVADSSQPVVSPVMDYFVNYEGGILGGDFKASVDADGNTAYSGAWQYIKITYATKDAAMAPASMDTISYVDGIVGDYVSDNEFAVQTWLTGTAAVMFEISQVIGKEFNKIELLVIVLIIILLFVVMKSYTIPFRSVLTILMSICWTLAATHIVFVNILGQEVMWLIPLILLVICLGLGMDYDILLTTRIKENVKARGMSNDEAIHHAVMHTGSVITICGLIMGGAFGTLMLSGMTMMQEFGFALCFAILVDALIVRTYIVPAVMHLLGDWNWKGPKFLDRSKKSEPSENTEE